MKTIKIARFLWVLPGLLCVTAALFYIRPAEVQPISLEEALRIAPESDKKILVDVYADWCPYCRNMHRDVYTKEEVIRAISDHFLWVKIDVESERMVSYHGREMTEAQFAQALENESVPATYFLDADGAMLTMHRGFIAEEAFTNLLRFVGTDAYLEETFEEHAAR